MAVLSVENVTVAFGGVKAVSDVSLKVDAAEIVGLIGPNGAGKTTLLNAICGMAPPQAGRICLLDRDVTGARASTIAGLGLGRTFQASQLFAGMTVLENMMAGLHLQTRAGLLPILFRARSMREEEEACLERARKALEFVGMERFADRPGSALSFGQQRIIEIARTLLRDPQVVLLDEPAVGLSVTRVAELDRLLRRIRDERGVALVLIEHVIRLVMGVCDRVVVLSSGRKIADAAPDAVRADPAVIEAYLGKSVHAAGA